MILLLVLVYIMLVGRLFNSLLLMSSCLLLCIGGMRLGIEIDVCMVFEMDFC